MGPWEVVGSCPGNTHVLMVSTEQSCREPAFCLQPGMAINQLQNSTEDTGTPAMQLETSGGDTRVAAVPELYVQAGDLQQLLLLLIRTEVQSSLAKTEQGAVP